MSTKKSKQKVTNTWNRFGDVHVSYNDSITGERKIEVYKNFPWYFVIKKEDLDKAKILVMSYPTQVKFIDDEKFPGYIKIYYQETRERKRGSVVLEFEDNGIETYEGDLLPDRRWYVDKEIEVADGYKKLYFDIETDDTNSQINVGKDRILSFGAVDDMGKEYFVLLESMTDAAEKRMMVKVLEIINEYDILLGWNSAQFDIPYLKERMRKYELHRTDLYRWKERGHFDLLKRFRHIFRFDSHIKKFNLDFISRYFIGRGKLDHTGKKVIDLYRKDKELLRAYNLEDCKLVKDLDAKLGVSDMMIRQCQWCGVPVSQFGLYSIIDAYILRMAHRVGKFGRSSLKSLRERAVEHERGNVNPDEVTTGEAKYTGAIVLEPKVGSYDRVYTFDFKSLYPSMIKTSNIGYDSLRYEASDNCIINPGTAAIFRKSGTVIPTYFVKEPSVITLAITDLLNKRGEYKDLKLNMIEEGTNHGPEWDRVVSDEIIVKELSNSTYGIMGLDYGRYYSVDIAESITLFGQWVINYAKEYFEGEGFNVIYGDTDSVFVATGSERLDIDKELEHFHLNLKRDLKEKFNIDECFIQLNFDKQYESLILIAKKSYVGHVINMEGKKTNQIYARGMEFIKKNTFSFASKKQRELCELILKARPSLDEVKGWLKDVREEFDKKEFTVDELTMTQRVGKDLDLYLTKTPPLHVRLAKELKKKTNQNYMNVEIDYIVTSSDPTMQGVLSSDFKGEFDKDFYWDNKTKPVLARITEIVFPEDDLFDPQQKLL